MKIYFAGSIRGGRADADLYAQIIDLLGVHGTVLTEHFGDGEIMASAGTGADVEAIFRQDMAWVTEADIVVAEVTTPSLGVGYELGRAEEMGKRCLCLYRPGEGRSLSAMVAGNPAMEVVEYGSVDDLEEVFAPFLTVSAEV